MTYLTNNFDKIHENLLKLSNVFSGKTQKYPDSLGYRVDADDFYQEAMLAIIKAEPNYNENYEKRCGGSFVTYATGIAINEMRKTLLENQSILSMSASTQNFMNKLNNEDDIEESAKKLKISVSRAKKIQQDKKGLLNVSHHIKKERDISIDDYIDWEKLDEQSAQIIQLYLQRESFVNIAKQLNISVTYLYNKFKEIIEKIREQNA